MLLILAIVAGLLVGLLRAGRVDALGRIRLRWVPLAIFGLLVQLVLFSPAVAGSVGAAGPPLYVASTALVFAALLRNLGRPGLALVTLGALLNTIVIVANGGYMPVSAQAIAAYGGGGSAQSYGNTVVAGTGTALPWLGDVLPIPAPPPIGNIVSIGDLLIGLGVALFIVRVMTAQGGARRPGSAPPPANAHEQCDDTPTAGAQAVSLGEPGGTGPPPREYSVS